MSNRRHVTLFLIGLVLAIRILIFVIHVTNPEPPKVLPPNLPTSYSPIAEQQFLSGLHRHDVLVGAGQDDR